MFALFFLSISLISPQAPSEKELDVIYHSIEPTSISKQFAFFHLYPETPQGRKALLTAWKLLACAHPNGKTFRGDLALPEMELTSLIQLVNQEPHSEKKLLKKEDLALIDELASPLLNRQLKGHKVWDKMQMRSLPHQEIDLARALLLEQYENPLEHLNEIGTYEATLDLMALQVLARLSKNASDEEKIKEISHLIFYEKGYRFPPHSLHIKDIDLYTFLPSVLDNHEGVCLGVSILYLCLAQRLNLPLEIVTPPGHIYVRYQKGDKKINIETTARGIHVDDEAYLSINTHTLPVRNMKEVVGMAAFNQASVFWQKGDYKAAIKRYKQAAIYMKNDPLISMFMGYNLLFVGEVEAGKKELESIADAPFPWSVSHERAPEDYLAGRVDVDGLKTIFSHVDASRDSIIQKQEKLHQVLAKFPSFRDGWFHLAVTYLQLGREKEGLQCLEAYHLLDPKNPTVEYYLAALNLERKNLKHAAKHLDACQKLLKSSSHDPKALKSLARALHSLYPR